MLRSTLGSLDGRQVTDLPPSGLCLTATQSIPDGTIIDNVAASLKPALITLRGVTKTYPGGTACVLHGIDADVARSERLALIGPNGAGKSTLLKCMVGLLTADQGEVRVMGMNPRNPRDAAHMRKRTGFVFQRHCLVNRTSALSNVINGLLGPTGSWRAVHQAVAPKHWRDRAMAALESVGLAAKAGMRVDQLSGGQAQRVAIARALVSEPELLIADEPAASLDPAAGHDVMGLFADLVKARGITLVFTTHDMDHAVTYADRVVALRDGRVALESSGGAHDRLAIDRIFNG